MPGKTPTLYVQGSCLCPTPKYELELKPRRPGINPEDLLLELTAREPTDIVPEVITSTPVSYSEETDDRYKTVSVLPDGPAGIPVLDVSE
jgi:hypothetical protein